MQNRPPRTVDEWLRELNAGDALRRQRAVEALAVLAPSNRKAADALRAAAAGDPDASVRANMNGADSHASAVASWLQVFRNGTAAEQREALIKLDELGEVERF